MLAQIHRSAARFAEVLAGLAVFGLLLLAIVTGGDVFMRFVFASPIRGLTDVTMVVAAVLLSACLPHVVASRGNITVDALGRRIGPRAYRALNFFGALVTCLFFAVMAWQCIGFALDMRSAGETMPTLRWPVWPWWSAVAVFISLTALVALATLTEPREEP
jgi:TRAP-type C4-dicarboxylate transport system permease small subunit